MLDHSINLKAFVIIAKMGGALPVNFHRYIATLASRQYFVFTMRIRRKRRSEREREREREREKEKEKGLPRGDQPSPPLHVDSILQSIFLFSHSVSRK